MKVDDDVLDSPQLQYRTPQKAELAMLRSKEYVYLYKIRRLGAEKYHQQANNSLYYTR